MDSQGDINSLGRQYVNASADQTLRSAAVGLGDVHFDYLLALQAIFLGTVFSGLGHLSF